MKVEFVDGRAQIRVREGLHASVEITPERQVRVTQNGEVIDLDGARLLAALGGPLEFWQPVRVVQAYLAAMPDAPVEQVRALAMNPVWVRVERLLEDPSLESVMVHDPSPKVRVQVAKRTRDVEVARVLSRDAHKTVRGFGMTALAGLGGAEPVPDPVWDWPF